ncbi:MAG TPA: glycosyltransferase [Candidatus Acidoferrum sp.]|nr:glycosyltransferase [Candidatus Acidoferrum sp.]
MSLSLSLNRKPRVLILSASSGAGHVRAAQAVEKAFRAQGNCEVEHIDALQHVTKLFQRLYDKAYIRMVRRAPELMGLLYEQTDKPWRHPRQRLAMDRLNTQPMIRLLKKIQPDLCVATHFLPAEILAWLIAKKKLQARHAIVVTDYDVHALWLCRTVDRYYVAMQESLEYLANIGVPRDKLRVTGIPIDPLFEQSVSGGDARKKLGLSATEPILLLSAGGYGVGPLEQLVKDLLAMQRQWQIVAIAGKSDPLKKRLDSLSKGAGKTPAGQPRLVPVGFTTEMDQYMAAADLLIGKAGGLTTSEALARGLPMALVEPIPGQEERNADHLLEAGAAIRCNNLPAAAWKIATLFDQPEKLRAMKQAARTMAHPDAARVIAQDARGLLH